VFDPVALTERQLSLAVGAESTFVVSDSAAYDSTARAWVPVRFDTVRAIPDRADHGRRRHGDR